MTWHGQINRTIWELENLLEKHPKQFSLKRELFRTHFLQHYEVDRSLHIPRDDRTFLFLQQEPAPACLLLHGGSGTPAELRDLGNHLYAKGYTVYGPRFARVDSKNRMVSWESWVTLAEQALLVAKRYSPEVNVVGLSLGGTLSLILNGMHSFTALVLLSPGIFPRFNMKEQLLRFGGMLMPTLFGRFSGWEGEMLKAMERVRKNPREIDIPALVLQARDDKRLSTRGLKHLRDWLIHPQSEVRLLPYGSHVLTRGEAREEVFNRISDFLSARVSPGT
jgi:carboxylesterase